MAATKKRDVDVSAQNDQFSSPAEGDKTERAKIRDIPLTEIDAFPNHPFKVLDDEDMEQLIDSVKKRGVITPVIVRQKEDGRYEIISGHRRKRACELAGLETLRCEVVDLTNKYISKSLLKKAKKSVIIGHTFNK